MSDDDESDELDEVIGWLGNEYGENTNEVLSVVIVRSEVYVKDNNVVNL